MRAGETRKAGLLRLVSDLGGEATRRQICTELLKYWELRPEERARRKGTNEPLYWHHAASVCQSLKDKDRYLENPRRGLWRITAKGEEYLSSMGYQQCKSAAETITTRTIQRDPSTTTSAKSVIDLLRTTQYKSKSYTEYEEAIKSAFEFFGFEAELIGGGGETDVLITANIGDETYKATVDGKTTRRGHIIEGRMNWDSLEDHRKKHSTDYTVVVAPGFSRGNLLERAEAHRVSLLSTEHLTNLIEEHSRYPITLLDLKDLFTQTGDLGERVDDLLEQNARRRELLTKFKTVLEEMSNLQDAHGYFNLDRLCGRLLEHEVDEDTLKGVIELLKLPFISSIKDLGDDRYILVNSVENIANLLKQISKELLGIEIGEVTIEKEAPEALKKKREFGTNYFEWEIKRDSIVARARKENPYEHYCPASHSIKIIRTIQTIFQELDIINAELVHQKLLGEELDTDRKYKGKPEQYKIRMMIGILELEGLLGWTGSKRPIEYKLNVPIGKMDTWAQTNIRKKA